MSKPVAKILVRQDSYTLSASNYFNHFLHKNLGSLGRRSWIPFLAHSKFLGLSHLVIKRIIIQTQVEIRMIFYPPWPDNWLGKLANLIFGRRVK